VEVLSGTLDVNEEVAVAPEAVSEARLGLAQPVVNVIKLFFFGSNESAK
jgi:hypothetical protein